MSNIITQADIDKFLSFLEQGMHKGVEKSLVIATQSQMIEGTNVAENHFIRLEFSFKISNENLVLPATKFALPESLT